MYGGEDNNANFNSQAIVDKREYADITKEDLQKTMLKLRNRTTTSSNGPISNGMLRLAGEALQDPILKFFKIVIKY